MGIRDRSKDKDGNDVLKVYGEKLLDRYDAVAADMRDAFKGCLLYTSPCGGRNRLVWISSFALSVLAR